MKCGILKYFFPQVEQQYSDEIEKIGTNQHNSKKHGSAHLQAINYLIDNASLHFIFLDKEQECFQEELRRAQRKLLKISRDKSFLLDRLLQYERVEGSSSDSESTASSDSEKEAKKVWFSKPDSFFAMCYSFFFWRPLIHPLTRIIGLATYMYEWCDWVGLR